MCFVILLLLIALYTRVCWAVNYPPKIAIVGGGIGGTSCAYFLRKVFGSGASITLFERNVIGGRISALELNGYKYESGASDIHPSHKYMVEFAKLFGLTRTKREYETWGVFDGRKIVFEASPWTAITLSKLFWKYGWSIFPFDAIMKTTNAFFSRIYSAQDKGLAFASVTSLIGHMSSDFADMTRQTLTSYLYANSIYDHHLVDELVQGMTMASFGQTNDINAFVGMLSLVNSVSEANMWTVKEGLGHIPSHLLTKSDAKLINAEVTTVSLSDDESYDLTYTVGNSRDSLTDDFDIVVIAVPLMSNARSIKFENFPDDLSRHEAPYQRTITTFIKGNLNKEAFGFRPQPEMIMPSNPTLGFNSISKVIHISDEELKEEEHNIYKVYSKAPLPGTLVRQLFQGVKAVTSRDWLSYPRYKTTSSIPPFILHPGLYYINAIEWAASYMEMSVIGSKNVALLARNAWTKKSSAKVRHEKDEL